MYYLRSYIEKGRSSDYKNVLDHIKMELKGIMLDVIEQDCSEKIQLLFNLMVDLMFSHDCLQLVDLVEELRLQKIESLQSKIETLSPEKNVNQMNQLTAQLRVDWYQKYSKRILRELMHVTDCTVDQCTTLSKLYKWDDDFLAAFKVLESKELTDLILELMVDYKSQDLYERYHLLNQLIGYSSKHNDPRLWKIVHHLQPKEYNVFAMNQHLELTQSDDSSIFAQGDELCLEDVMCGYRSIVTK
ncbi:hisS [Acrasis kona]|uniref:HisS n=1 Tax=Acrasis kona TaxID=1008807 RepID=A0AAW2YVA4_9EUKA